MILKDDYRSRFVNSNIRQTMTNNDSADYSWDIEISSFADNSINPIRHIVENLKVTPNPNKKMIPLSIGDPTIFGNLTPSQNITDALVEAVTCGKYNGYLPSNGLESAREAVASYVSVPGAEIDAKDVYLTSGASHALDMCVALLGSPGKNILIPRPGFPLYKTICGGYGIDVRSYDLNPEDNWKVDLRSLESQVDNNTVAIIYNNPSNPCGSVYSKEHMTDILKVAERYCLPIIADEIYENMVFPGETFYPIASLTTEVPVLSCRGTTKRFLIPGMRLGWITVHDRHNRLGQSARNGLNKLCQRLMGPNAIVQGALKKILEDCPGDFFEKAIRTIKNNADYALETLSKVPGLRPIQPSGAMYIMVGIDMDKFPHFSTDLQLMEGLVSEESVFCLPGQCFDLDNFMRIVLTVPEELTKEACNRMASFFTRHYVSQRKKSLTEIDEDNLIINGLPVAGV